MSKTSHNLKEWAQLGFQNFIAKEEYNSPDTEIVNRAPVPFGLDVVLGIERIETQSIDMILNEFGPNGEPVYQMQSKDARIRAVGNGWTQQFNTNGSYVYTNNQNDYIDIVFYGTGLNMLSLVSNDNRDIRISVDGGAEGGSTIYPTGIDNELENRDVNTNELLQVVNGLAQGWHHVKIRLESVDFVLYGFEIVNETSQLTILPGSGFSGTAKQTLTSQQSIDYKPSLMTGTDGGRVITYLKDGQISQAFNEQPSTAQFLGSADNSNADLVRKLNYADFSSGNAANDFSTLTGTVANKGFTMNDGSHALVGVNVSSDDVRITGNGSGGGWWTITFIGTGLAIVTEDNNGSVRSDSVIVDGVDVGDLDIAANENGRIIDLCSDLPYGVHTVKLLSNTAATTAFTKDFMIYQPAKPAIPNDAVQIADYNVLADFDPTTALTTTVDAISEVPQGTIPKMNMREFIYNGTWGTAFNTVTIVSTLSGYEVGSSTNGDYFEYTFFGTGVSFHFRGVSGSIVTEIQIDGVADNTGTNVVNGSNNGDGTYTWVSGSSIPRRVSFENLPLGVHTLRVTRNSGSGALHNATVFVATPIHINDPGLKIGSLSLAKESNQAPIIKDEAAPDIGKAKAIVNFDGTNNEIRKSHNIAAIIDNGTGDYWIYFNKPFKDRNYVLTGNHSGDGAVDFPSTIDDMRPSYIRIFTKNSGGSNVNSQIVMLALYGDLQGE